MEDKNTDIALDIYLQMFAGMVRNKNKKGQLAPHKPILLLTIIDLVEMHRIRNTDIELTPVLVKHFRKVWDQNVPNGIKFNPDITKPYYHLNNEPFWNLIPAYQEVANLQVAEEAPASINPAPQYTLRYMRETFRCARIDRSLYLLMCDHDSRIALRRLLHSLLSSSELNTNIFNRIRIEQLNIKGDLNVSGDVMATGSRKTIKHLAA